MGSCNTLSDLTNWVFVSNKTEDLNLSVFNVIAGINELKIITKHVSCKCNNYKYRCECKILFGFIFRLKSFVQKWYLESF